jgi:hypothetical protein
MTAEQQLIAIQEFHAAQICYVTTVPDDASERLLRIRSYGGEETDVCDVARRVVARMSTCMPAKAQPKNTWV